MNISIVGTGLIGTSIGLALKAARVKATIVGTDKNYDAANKARKRGALDKAERRLRRAVEDAELVILATPTIAIGEILEYVGPYLAEDCVVTDTASSKGPVLVWADQYLPRSVHFVGGHPIAGKDKSGPDEADANLFQECTYCIVPSRGSSQKAVGTVVQMVERIGAKPYFLNAEEHDSYAAVVTHLPALLSAALMKCVSRSPSWPDIAKVAAPTYKSFTSLASTNPEMNRDMCATNPEGIIHWIDEFVRELQQVRELLASDDDSLKPLDTLFTSAQEERTRWLSGALAHRGQGPVLEGHSLGDQMGELLMGRKLMEMYKRTIRRTEKRDQR